MDPKTILKTIKEASPFELFLISFLLLPFIADAWLDVMHKMELGLSARYCGIAIVVVAYFAGILFMLKEISRAKNREIARDKIVDYLTTNKFEMMSFERVRDKINSAYTNDFLESLIKHFPNVVRKAILKGSKPGIARMVESDANEEK